MLLPIHHIIATNYQGQMVAELAGIKMGESELLPQVTFAHRFSKRLENWPTVQQDLASKIVKIACTLDCRPAFGLKGMSLRI
jgi:hypothetical protein